MSDYSVRARPPRGPLGSLRLERDPDILASHLHDAAHFPGGHADALVVPETEADVAAALTLSSSVLPIGAQSSLTGGATPMGDLLLSTARMKAVEWLSADAVRVQPGISLAELDVALAARGARYPPVPTYTGATVGGVVATNAAGAATFKYGSTRDWVEALTVVLPSGEVIDLERGAVVAHPDGYFDIELSGRTARVVVPGYQMPEVAKLSAGYYARPGMDLVDLFVGAEGTLGVVTAVTLRVVPTRPAQCVAFVPCPSRQGGLALVRDLRDLSRATWIDHDPNGIDVAAIEHVDRRCLELLREDGLDRLNGVVCSRDTEIALLVALELAPDFSPARAYDEIGRAREARAPDGPVTRFCRLLDAAGVFDDVEVAVPGDFGRLNQLMAAREAVPAAVNARVGRGQRDLDPRIEKIAADIIVPTGRLTELLDRCDEEFSRRGLDAAIWGHISDGNLHPNVMARSAGEVDAGKAAMLSIGRVAIALGGAPLAEHGVGRNLGKQQLLRELYGDAGVAGMQRVKQALDPDWRLSPGVIFPGLRRQ
jgi:D-lactate dehydrogenase (cytochrome)